MPDIDVSDLCLDPDIAGESFTVVRRQSVMQPNGTTAITSTYFQASGSITPTGDNSLVRADAYTTQAGTIAVITNFRLRSGGKDNLGNAFQPDIVLTSDGNSFVVSSLNEWDSFGGGFMHAECTEIDFNPMGPT
jgi:hypothetical protein